MRVRFACALFLLFCLLFLPGRTKIFAFPDTENVEYRFIINGQEIEFIILPFIKGKEVFVPLKEVAQRSLLSYLGASIYWKEEKKVAIINYRGSRGILHIDPPHLELEGKKLPIDEPPFLKDGEVFIALSTILDIINGRIIFNEEKKIYYINPSLKEIKLSQVERHLRFVISASAPFQYSTKLLKDPQRLIIDIPNMVIPEEEIKDLPQDERVFYEIKASQYSLDPPTTRIVLALKEGTSWNIPSRIDLSKMSVVIESEHITLPSEEKGVEKIDLEKLTEIKKIHYQEVLRQGINYLKVTIETDRPVEYEWHRLRPPDNRIFIDFFNSFCFKKEEYEIDHPLVSKIHMAQFQKEPQPVVRVVIHMKDAYQSNIYSPPSSFRQLILEIKEKKISPALSYQTGKASTGILSGKGKLIVLDPGHGGSDPGAVLDSLEEKNLTLDICLRLRKLLLEDGYQVVLTRDKDREVLGRRGEDKEELGARVKIANRIKADVFISVHINAAYSRIPSGSSSHWYKAIDLSLARCIQDSLASTKLVNRGIYRNRFYVLRHSQMPAVLLELGFMTNPRDRSLLLQPSFRDELARSIRDGLRRFFGLKK